MLIALSRWKIEIGGKKELFFTLTFLKYYAYSYFYVILYIKFFHPSPTFLKFIF